MFTDKANNLMIWCKSDNELTLPEFILNYSHQRNKKRKKAWNIYWKKENISNLFVVEMYFDREHTSLQHQRTIEHW